MKKLRTALFWKIIFGYTLLFILIRFILDFVIEETFFESKRIIGVIISAILMGTFMAFYTKQKSTSNTDFNDVE